MITTSRAPSSKLRTFAKVRHITYTGFTYFFNPFFPHVSNILFKEVRLLFPNAKRINRGKTELKQLMHACRSVEATDLILLSEHRGKPGEKNTIFP